MIQRFWVWWLGLWSIEEKTGGGEQNLREVDDTLSLMTHILMSFLHLWSSSSPRSDPLCLYLLYISRIKPLFSYSLPPPYSNVQSSLTQCCKSLVTGIPLVYSCPFQSILYIASSDFFPNCQSDHLNSHSEPFSNSPLLLGQGPNF